MPKTDRRANRPAKTQTLLPCPKCASLNITSCIGGSRLRPSKWEREHIKYICMDCFYEFGDYDVNKEE